MNSFETKSIINKDTVREVKRHLWRPQDIKRILLLSVLSTAVAVWGGLNQSILMFVIGAIGIVVVLVVIIRNIVLQRKMWGKIGKTSAIEQVVSFSEDGIVVFDSVSGGTFTIEYDQAIRFVETASFYLLFTYANQLIAVNKEVLTQKDETDDFLKLLEEKCTSIKWKKGGKQ